MVCCVNSHLWLFCKGMLECLEKMLTRLKWKLKVNSHLWLLCKGMLKCLEKMLTRPKWKLELEWNFFWRKAFLKFHIAISSCMKFEDVLEILPMFMLESFLYWFIFIWGHEQCSKMFGET
jgi:hypothetical protein